MNAIKHIIFGITAKGDNVIDKQPGFRTSYPDVRLEFNSWSSSLRVGSRVQKNDLINPWYRDRK